MSTTQTWRVGSKVGLNVYKGSLPVCQCHTEEDARKIVEAVNLHVKVASAQSKCTCKPMQGSTKWVEKCAYCLSLPGRVAELERENVRLLALLNTPEIEDFDKAVPLESAHQQERWGTQHDAGKNPEDWFWLVGYLAGKALHAQKTGDRDKAKHHCISTAAALRNWHAHIRSGESAMRPGIEDTNV
jgi:hypothetical protein